MTGPIDDDVQIRNLLGLTALLADEGEVEDYHRVYTEDATWSAAGATQEGLDAIVESSRARRESGTVGPGAHTRHVLTPLTIEVDGDTAQTVSYLCLLKQADSAPQIGMFAVYEDQLRRTENGWRIAARVIRGD